MSLMGARNVFCCTCNVFGTACQRSVCELLASCLRMPKVSLGIKDVLEVPESLLKVPKDHKF